MSKKGTGWWGWNVFFGGFGVLACQKKGRVMVDLGLWRVPRELLSLFLEVSGVSHVSYFLYSWRCLAYPT
ncbi:hypothetical protein ES703_121278 [subsurface metagenome]